MAATVRTQPVGEGANDGMAFVKAVVDALGPLPLDIPLQPKRLRAVMRQRR